MGELDKVALGGCFARAPTCCNSLVPLYSPIHAFPCTVKHRHVGEFDADVCVVHIHAIRTGIQPWHGGAGQHPRDGVACVGAALQVLGGLRRRCCIKSAASSDRVRTTMGANEVIDPFHAV